MFQAWEDTLTGHVRIRGGQQPRQSTAKATPQGLLRCRAQARTEFSMEKLTDDVVGVIRHLGYEKCVLVGHGERQQRVYVRSHNVRAMHAVWDIW